MKADNSYGFQKQLVTLMQAQMFKDIKAATTVAQKKKGKQAGAATEKSKAGIQAKEKAVRVESTAPGGRGKKNRKERRKD